jgi:MerR family transcriptional regulator, thiopeptide resistance regulator
MQSRRTYQVKEVASSSGLSIRALHYYDAIGLLVPSFRTAAGYRLYDADDLLRLQQILIGRELGLSLEDIRRSLDDPSFDRRRALLEQRAALERRARHTTEMIHAIDAAIAIIDGVNDAAIVEEVCDAPRSGASFNQQEGTTVDIQKIFDGFDPDKYADETRQRWGNGDAYEISMRRTRSYSEADWERFKQEQGAIYAAAAAAMKSGKGPADAAAMDVAERHRLSIDRWFYPCSAQLHCGLADMYEADQRFRENIDKTSTPPVSRRSCRPRSARTRSVRRRSDLEVASASGFDTVVGGRLTFSHLWLLADVRRPTGCRGLSRQRESPFYFRCSPSTRTSR